MIGALPDKSRHSEEVYTQADNKENEKKYIGLSQA